MDQAKYKNNGLVAFSAFGGKAVHLSHILPLLPSVEHYVEPFGFSGAVLLNRPKSRIETFNEINDNVTNFFEVLRNHTDQFIDAIRLTPNSESEFKKCWDKMFFDPDPIERARCFYIRSNCAYSGCGALEESVGFQYNKVVSETSKKTNSKVLISKAERLFAVANRFRNVQILNRSAFDLIPKFNGPGYLIYEDPTYLKTSRTSSKKYLFELTKEDHINLAEINNESQSMIAISHYECDLYNELYPAGKWFKHSWKSAATTSKRKVTECLWMNYDIEAIHNYRLFPNL